MKLGHFRVDPKRARLVVLGGAAWLLLLSVLISAGLSTFVDHRVVRALEFRARDLLGRTPTLDPRLKVYALDDSTSAMLGGTRLSPSQWVKLLDGITSRAPRAVLIDALFSSDQDVAREQELALAGLGKARKNVFAGALISPSPIRYREELPVAQLHATWARVEGDKDASIVDMSGGHVYGPAAKFRAAFSNFGHIVQPWPGRFAPAVRMSHGIIAHLTAHAATSRTIGPQGVTLDGAPVPVDSEGLTPIDFLPPAETARRVLSLKGALVKAESGDVIESVKPGDVVVLIHNFSTGNTDIVDSPYGQIPGGYAIMAIANSVLRGAWLKKLPYEVLLSALACLLGALFGSAAGPAWFWAGAVLGGALGTLVSLGSFAYFGIFVPWVSPLLGFFLSGVTTFTVQRWRESQRRLQLEIEMATASTLQQHFFPSPNATHKFFDLAAHYHPAESVGGDWYSYYANDRTLHIHVGDVTGHGTSAALLASFAKGATDMLYRAAENDAKPWPEMADLHRNLNDIMLERSSDFAFMSIFSLAIDLATGATQFVNSGHRPAMVAGKGPKAEALFGQTGSNILGHAPFESKIKPGSRTLTSAETLLVMSDGLIEVPMAFGVRIPERSIRKLLTKVARESSDVREVRGRLLSELQLDHNQSRPFSDDVTFVVVRLKLAS